MTQNNFWEDGWTPGAISSLVWKTYLITGANSGTGYEASKILLSKGARVVMLNRNPEKSEAAIDNLKEELGENIDLHFVKIDLGSLESMRNAVEEV